jgi:two-component system response regulator YesN
MQRSSNAMAQVLKALYVHRGHLTEAEAAQLVGISTSWFRHDFKRHTNMSFRTARVQAKLAHGAHLLSATRLTIPEIAQRLGYSDRSKFEKAFKRLHRLTPTVYRDVLQLTLSSTNGVI